MFARFRLLFAILVLAGATAFKPATPPRQRSAILISWDGALREHVNDCLKRNQMPNLAQLTQEGRWWTSKYPVTSPTPKPATPRC